VIVSVRKSPHRGLTEFTKKGGRAIPFGIMAEPNCSRIGTGFAESGADAVNRVATPKPFTFGTVILG